MQVARISQIIIIKNRDNKTKVTIHNNPYDKGKGSAC